MEPFTLIEESTGPEPHHLYDDMVELSSAKSADHDIQYMNALRKASPDMIVTSTPATNVDLRAFAAAGHATCELDTKTDSMATWRGYVPPRTRSGIGGLGEQIHFAKYVYLFGDESFVLYTVGGMQYILKERVGGEHTVGPSEATDILILTVGEWQNSMSGTVWVFDQYWQKSADLYREVEKANWGKVILDEQMKKELVGVTDKFFDSKDVYEDLGVPWKRGLIFGGSPGNGKTISIKALMHTLLFERKAAIPTLYVKAAPNTYAIRNVFTKARTLAPCMLVLEDIETIVTPITRSYFFNEMDGLENNDGIFVVASTNFLDRLDPGLSKRPSRFDRTYIFPLPDLKERVLYCEFWKGKLSNKPDIDFPLDLCVPMASITDGFSFAFLQECFVATLLILARREISSKDDSDDQFRRYPLYRIFKQQADLLRKQLDGASLLDEEDPFNFLLSQPIGPPRRKKASRAHRRVENEESSQQRLPVLNAEDDDGILPVLPWPERKSYVINTAAYMAKQ